MVLNQKNNKYWVAAGVVGVAIAVFKYRSLIANKLKTIFSKDLLLKQKIEVIESKTQCDDAIHSLSRGCKDYKVLGFDCEWVTTNGRRHPVALLQLASADGYCALFRLSKIRHVPNKLKVMDKQMKKKYTKEMLMNALESIKNGSSIYKASKDYGVPKTTLKDKIHGKYKDGSTPGASTILTATEEHLIVKWIVNLGLMGFPVTKIQLIQSVAELVKKLNRPNTFKDGIPGRHWYESFIKRHPELTHRVSQNLTQTRSNISEAGIRGWFGRVDKYIKDNNFQHVASDPKRVFNCDETAFLLCPKDKQVLVKKGSKQVYTRIGNDEKQCLTVLVNVSAVGTIAPPMILYKYKRIPKHILTKYPKGWGMGRSDTGWMNCQTFYEYITNVFYPWLLKTKIELPIILYLDGHTSHFTLALNEFCRDKGIILVALYPNATHILQPLDVAVFHPMKNCWKDLVKTWRLKNNGEKIQLEDFAPLVKNCLETSITPNTVQNGFKTTGLYPFDMDGIDYTKLLSHQLDLKNDTLLSVETIQKTTPEFNQDGCSSFLVQFEKRLSSFKLDTFRNSGEEWSGPLEDQNLFYFWREILLTNHDTTLDANMSEITTDINMDNCEWIDNMIELDIPQENIVNTSSIIVKSSTPKVPESDNVEHSMEEQTSCERTPIKVVQKDTPIEEFSTSPKVPEFGNPNKHNVQEQNANDITPLKIDHKIPNEDFPTPFKAAFFWPQSVESQKKKKITKRLTPTVATSDEFIEHQRRIQIEKDQKEKEKLEKRLNKIKATEKKKKTLEMIPASSSSSQNVDINDNCFTEGEYVIVFYEGEYFPGIILSLDEEDIEVKTMSMFGQNWRWPEREDILHYKKSKIVLKIDPPTLLNSRGLYSVPQIDELRQQKVKT